MKQRAIKYLAVIIVIFVVAVACIPASTLSTAAATPYETTGLEALYLGNNNTGSGQNTSATTWTDMSSKGNDITGITANATNYFTADGFHLNTFKVMFPQAIVNVVNGQQFTFEMVLGEFTPIGTGFNTFVNSANDSFSLFRRVDGDFIEFKNAANARPKVAGGEEYFKNSTVTITFKVGGNATMYVDGVQIGQTSAVSAIAADNLWFGHDLDTRNFETDYLAMRFYSVELTAAQVLANYNDDLTLLRGNNNTSSEASSEVSTNNSSLAGDISSAISDNSAAQSNGTSSKASDETSAPVLGDTGTIIFALITVLAIGAFAFVIIKRKAARG